MTMPELYAINKAKPFVPFKLHLADGQTVEVKNEGDALIPPRGWAFAVYQYHKPEEMVRYVTVSQITTIEFEESPVVTSGQGNA